MSALAPLQRALQRHVLQGSATPLGAIAEPPRGSRARRLEIYASAYRARLVEALADDYPALQCQLGAVRFEALVHEYVAAEPSVFRNLRWYGAGLAPYMARRPRWRRPLLLVELARFEWALGLAFDAADAPLLAPEALAALPAARWPTLRFRLQPSVQRLALRSNAPAAWFAAVRKRRKVRATGQRSPRQWLVWRKDSAPYYRELAADEAWALDALARGCDFAALCAGLRRFVGRERAAQHSAQLLRNWITDELLAAT